MPTDDPRLEQALHDAAPAVDGAGVLERRSPTGACAGVATAASRSARSRSSCCSSSAPRPCW